MKVDFVIDGFNLYHSIIKAGKNKKGTRWLNLHSLCSSYLIDIDTLLVDVNDLKIGKIYYFSALATHLINKEKEEKGEDKVTKHQKYISVLKDTGVVVSLGKFKFKQHKYITKVFKAFYNKYEEKETDVAIGIKLFEIFYRKEAGMICLITADSDLVSAVKTVKHNFPDNKVIHILPFSSKGKDLSNICDLSIKMTKNKVLKNQFPDEYIMTDGKSIQKPLEW